MASSRSISNGTVRYYTVRFHPPIPAHNERSPRRSKSGGEKRRRRRKKWKRAAAYRMQTERRGSGGTSLILSSDLSNRFWWRSPRHCIQFLGIRLNPGTLEWLEFGLTRLLPVSVRWDWKSFHSRIVRFLFFFFILFSPLSPFHPALFFSFSFFFFFFFSTVPFDHHPRNSSQSYFGWRIGKKGRRGV